MAHDSQKGFLCDLCGRALEMDYKMTRFAGRARLNGQISDSYVSLSWRYFTEQKPDMFMVCADCEPALLDALRALTTRKPQVQEAPR